MKRAQATQQPLRHSKRKRFSCQECVNVDDDDMVMCEICNKWSHYCCAGVGPEIADSYFSCQTCQDIDKYINSTDTYVKARATEKKIRDTRKLSKDSHNELAERDIIQEINSEREQSELDPEQLKIGRVLSELYPDQSDAIQEINSEPKQSESNPDQSKVGPEFIDFVEAEVDQPKENESLELAQAILVVPEPESKIEAGAVGTESIDFVEIEQIQQSDQPEENESELARAIFVVPEPESEIEAGAVGTESIDFVEIEQIQQSDQPEENESELAQAIFVVPEPEPEIEAGAVGTESIDFVEIEQIQQGDQPEENESDLAQAVFVVPEPKSNTEAGAAPELYYELPIRKKKHIKNFNTILKSKAVLSAQAQEHSDNCFCTDFKEMVRMVSPMILSDKFLRNYSYCGQTKKKLEKYAKVVELIVLATQIRFPTEEPTTILAYFKKDYVKYAPRRYNRANN